MTPLPTLTPSAADVAAGRYTPRARWSTAQRWVYDAVLVVLAGPHPRRRITVAPRAVRR